MQHSISDVHADKTHKFLMHMLIGAQKFMNFRNIFKKYREQKTFKTNFIRTNERVQKLHQNNKQNYLYFCSKVVYPEKLYGVK